jgi:uncharacterized protein (TIGR03435 family)
MRCLVTLLPTLLLATLTTPTHSQASNPSPTTPAFEVASIRPEEPGGTSAYVKIGFEQNGYTATGATLQLLLQEAYGIDDDRQILGAPAWAGSQSYTIIAKIDDATANELSKLNDDQRNLAQQRMLQALLADRFNLTLHRETKELPIYSLVIAKNGPKLHEAKPGDTYANGAKNFATGAPLGPHFVDFLFLAGQVQMKAQGASLDLLVNRLTQKASALQLGRKIVDNTGLTGKYDFDLHFEVPWQSNGIRDPEVERAQGTSTGNGGDTSPESSDTSLFTALQEQLGIKLESTRGPVETLVIDHVDKPSAN